MNPFGAGELLYWHPARSHFQRTLNRKRWGKVGMNFAAYQEKEKNEETKTSKKMAEGGRGKATDFKEAVCCPSAGVQGAARQKMVCARKVPGVTGSLRKSNSHLDSTRTGSGTAPPC